MEWKIVKKKPIEFKASQLTQEMLEKNEELLCLKGRFLKSDGQKFIVQTLEGLMTGKVGDWIIVGVEAEMYICDGLIFNKTYDVVRKMPLEDLVDFFEYM